MDTISFLVKTIRENLTPDLLRGKYRSGVGVAGHCYVAAETLYHMLGGKASGLKPHNGRLGDVQHWWLEDSNGIIIDPTADQFPNGFPYGLGRGRCFLTAKPSRRASILMERVVSNWISQKP